MTIEENVLTADDSYEIDYCNNAQGHSIEDAALLLHPEKSPEISKFRHGGPRENSGGNRPGAGRPRKPPVTNSFQASLGWRWCVVESERGFTVRSVKALAAMRFRVYMPKIEIKQRKIGENGKPELVSVFKPRFFNFFFVHLDLDRFDWVRIQPSQESRVKRLILTPESRPAALRAYEADEIEKMMAADEASLKPMAKRMPICSVGRLVLITRGPFEGKVCPVVSCDGFITVVEVQLLGATMPVRLVRRDVSDE